MPKYKYKKFFIELLFLSITAIVLANIISIYRSHELNKESLQTTSFTLLDTSRYTIEEKKPLILHFWATWCPICRAELSNIELLSKHYQVITVVVKSGNSDLIKEYTNQHKLNFKVINDSDGSMARKFNVSMFPTTIIYDKNKNIAFTDIGYTSTFGILLKIWWVEKFN